MSPIQHNKTQRNTTKQHNKKTAQTAANSKQGATKPTGLLKKEATVSYDKLANVSKATLTRIEINTLPKEKPDFKAPGATKDGLVTDYLTHFIVAGLKKGTLTELSLLPRKQDIAKHLGVSVGTVQNAIRVIEDYGHVESKQRIGTIVRDASKAKASGRLRKQTSKRDRAVLAVKQFIINRRLDVGEPMPSAREIADAIGSAPNTTRLALEYLTHEGILHSYGTRGNKANWEIKVIPTIDKNAETTVSSETLIDQVERDLKDLIAKNHPVSTKLPSHLDLADTLKVSIKTIHDAMKRLGQQGVVSSKRGRYGTFVLRTPGTDFVTSADKLFVPVDEQEIFYTYEKVEGYLKQLIKQDYKVGDKLPPMGDLSTQLEVSSNTIRKALQALGDQGLVRFARGRYGGTFVKKVPDVKASKKALNWVSVNPETMKSYRA